VSTVELTIDVFCQKNWDSSPVYRIYVDNDLLTERTWIWPSYEIFIKENILVDLDPGKHRIAVQTCGPNSDNIVFRNLTGNGVLLPKTSREDHQEYNFEVVQSSNGSLAINILYLDL
jgi:hypothetical protein